MARKPGPLNPEGSGKGSLSLGQSSQGAKAVANQRAGAGAAAKAAQARGIKETFNVEGITRRFKAMGYSEAQINKAIYKPQPRVVKPLPAAGSVDQVKLTAQQFGQKVSGKQAKAISALLRGRGAK